MNTQPLQQSEIDDDLHEALCVAANDDGYNARMDGKAQTDNPWTEAGTIRNAWDAGWLQASAVIRELRFSDHYHG